MLIEDIEYVIFCHPDLAAIRDFMISYGLLDLQQTDDTLYLRSYDDAPFSYVSTKGEAAFVGFGFRVPSREALERLAARFGSAVTGCPHPGGGVYIAVTDPDGRRLEFVFGAERLPPVAAFMHLGKGAEWTDHHTLAIVGAKAAGLDHASFECRDIDDLGIGHMVMGDKGYKHRWGIGRHFHGSQIFDNWTDPAGFHMEHYVDGDVVNGDSPVLSYPFGRETLLQWGPAFPGALIQRTA